MWAGSVSILGLIINGDISLCLCSYNLQSVLLVFVNRSEVTLAISLRTFLQLTTFIPTKNLKFQQRYENN